MNKRTIFTEENNIAHKILELSSEIYVLTHRSDNSIAFCSNKLVDLCGTQMSQLVDQPFATLFQNNSDKEFSALYGGFLDHSDQKHIQQLNLTCSQGILIPAMVTSYTKLTDAGLEAYNCHFIRAITDNKLEENVLEIKKMFQNVLNTIPARIFWKNKDLVYLGSNDKFSQDAGVKPNESILGKTDFDLAWKTEEAEFFRAVDKRVIDSGKAELGIVEPQLNADGTETWLETNKAPLVNYKGEIIGILGTYTDITQRKKSVDEIKKNSKELEIKNKELEQFAHITSHDLQEPLRSLTSFIELLSLDYMDKFDDTGKTYLNFINEAANRMRNLITGLLEYSLLSREVEDETVDCNIVLEDVLKDLAYTIEENQAKINIEQKLPILISKRLQVHLLFQNIIQNAIKFKKPNTTPEISISVINKGEFWEFNISDNGIGLNPAYANKIFTLFQRLHSASEYEGSGIGLAYCKKIIHLLGGDIWVESQMGKGSSFIFTIKKIQ